ncbi:MAG: ArsR/SmtB family transcription factor [Gammaproteobacteria bacterium]
MIDTTRVVRALDALAHEARLEVFLALVEAGPAGQSAGALAKRLNVTPNALSFHLTRLRHAALIQSWREGQRIFYATRYEEMEGLVGFLTDRCCRQGAETCGPVCGNRQQTGTQAASG